MKHGRRQRLRALSSLILILGCGRGRDIDLGHVTPPTDSGRGGGEGACGAKACANHEGSKVFATADVPKDAGDRFASATRHPSGTDAAREPSIVYPSHETLFPINVSHVLHEWTDPIPGSWFELTFTGPKTHVRVYTTSLRFTPTEEEWDWIAESNRGGTVELVVTALDPASSQDAWRSTAVELSFSDIAIEGAIYYWSTGTQGVMKAFIDDASPVKFYEDPSVTEKAPCVGCHSLSRDGKRMAFGYDGERLREIAVDDRSLILPATGSGGGVGGAPPVPPKMDPAPEPPDPKSGDAIPSAWTTFSPDGESLLVAANGTLRLLDADTGEPLGAGGGVVPIPEGTVATHPDWSALGDHVAVTLAEKGGDKDVERGSIAVLPYRDGAWGPPEILVAHQGGEDNNFFPAFSPDSRFIAYVNCVGKSRNARSATVRLIRLEDRAGFTLTRLNERVGPLDKVTLVGNSMPTWAPSTRPGLFWLAFSSVRAYATVREQDEKKDQIWLAAIDVKRQDPSYSAFWAPFQNIAHGNHRAFWTHSEDDRQCHCSDVCGDGIDNDCDGTADEADCLASCADREVCGDGIDNDCNCVVDDCSVERCDDGIDNDGDDLADAEDPSCAPP